MVLQQTFDARQAPMARLSSVRPSLCF